MSKPAQSSGHSRRQRSTGVVAVVRRNDLFLVILRSNYVSAPNTYCFPGGGVEAGEDEPTAVQRELNEELAIAWATPLRLLWRNKSIGGVDLGWWLTEIQTEPAESANPAEVAEVHWWNREELLAKTNLLETNREFFTAWSNGEFEL